MAPPITATTIMRRGFTLIELTVSIAMFSIIALALGSTVMLASKASPDVKGTNASQIGAARAAERLTTELSYALSVTEMTSTAVTFTVADRNGDGSPETIRYAWSGVAGDPLTRQYNGGAAANVLDSVQEFSLAFDKTSTKNPTTYTETAETLLYSFNSGLFSNSYTIQSNTWCGQYFVPNLPNGISYWRVTHVKYLATKDSGSTGETRVQVRTATSGGLPTTNVVDQTSLYESSLSSGWTWIDSYFTGTTRLDPSAKVCIVFRWANDDEACDILSKTLSLALGSGAQMVMTSNSGSSWGATTLSSIPLYVYGVTATQNADTYTYNLTGVRVVLRNNTNTTARVNTAAQVFSLPTVTGP